jgi:hypothetical protein
VTPVERLCRGSRDARAFPSVTVQHREAGEVHAIRERQHRQRSCRSIVVADEKAALARLRYILAHGAKEGLVKKPADWPGPNCVVHSQQAPMGLQRA